LILLDLKLSDLSGPALLNRLHGMELAVPFIVVTGQGDERVAVEMMKQGALDYLIKDGGMLDRLPVVVRRVLEKLASEQALAQAHRALLESERRILDISEAERQRIGSDLHDNLGQQLTAIELLCHSLKEDLHEHPALEVQMGRICRFLREAVGQTRQLARGLMPVFLTDGGLADGLAEMVARMNRGTARCHFIQKGPVHLLDGAVATHLFRIAQEAMNNAVKHSEAESITFLLSQTDEELLLKIEDDGRGMSRTEKETGGLGLQIMRHRANVIGATFEMISTPGRGLTVVCSMKKAP